MRCGSSKSKLRSDLPRLSLGVGVGVHPFNDPHLDDDFSKVDLPIDVSEWHVYAAIWTPDDVTFFVDGYPVKYVEQSPQYPMQQLMLNIYDFEPPTPDRSASPFQIERLRILQTNGPGR